MRVVAWMTILAFVVAAMLGLAGVIDLRADAFPLLMGFFAIMFVVQAWANQWDGQKRDG
jgi:hypothetical protein